MKKYRIAQVGCGRRGKIHIKGITENSDHFEIAGLCDLDEAKMKDAADKFGIKAPLYTDVEKMLRETRPDIFTFVTRPDMRQSLVELGVKYGVRGMSFEKPMATSLKEAATITRLCKENGIKSIVSHQLKYSAPMQKIKGIVYSGEIGNIRKIHVNTQAWLSQLGTHFIDYALWINGGVRAKHVVAHVHGKEQLSDSHPSPDFVNSTVILEDGVRVYFECGYLSEQNQPDDNFWRDNRLVVYGTHGYCWAESDGDWAALTKKSGGELIVGKEDNWFAEEQKIQTPYYKDLADWMDDDEKPHSCNIDISYHGYEIIEGMCLSALHNIRIDLPLKTLDYGDVNQIMQETLPEIKTYSGKKSSTQYRTR